MLAEITEKLAAITEGVRETASTYSEIDHAADARLDEIAARAPDDAEDD